MHTANYQCYMSSCCTPSNLRWCGLRTGVSTSVGVATCLVLILAFAGLRFLHVWQSSTCRWACFKIDICSCCCRACWMWLCHNYQSMSLICDANLSHSVPCILCIRCWDNLEAMQIHSQANHPMQHVSSHCWHAVGVLWSSSERLMLFCTTNC